jgi:hypothetical protein
VPGVPFANVSRIRPVNSGSIELCKEKIVKQLETSGKRENRAKIVTVMPSFSKRRHHMATLLCLPWEIVTRHDL